MTMLAFIFTLFSMFYFMYGIWVLIECTIEINSLVASEMIDLRTDSFKVASYVLFDKGLASIVFYCLALFGLAKMIPSEDGGGEAKEESE